MIPEPGVLYLLPGAAPTIVVGDATLVTLEMRDASGFNAMAGTLLTLNFAIDTMFAVTDGTSTIGTLQIDPASFTVSFWVRADQDGTGELVITSPNFRTFCQHYDRHRTEWRDAALPRWFSPSAQCGRLRVRDEGRRARAFPGAPGASARNGRARGGERNGHCARTAGRYRGR